MKNLRELFTLYPFGFRDFGPWVDHHKAMHKRHLLECAEFDAEWLHRWSEIGRLLQAPAHVRVIVKPTGRWGVVDWGHKINVMEALDIINDLDRTDMGVRLTLINGTIVREWGPK